MRSTVNDGQSSRMCSAFSSGQKAGSIPAFCRSQYSQRGSVAKFILNRWLLRLLCPVITFISILISLVDSLRSEFFNVERLKSHFLTRLFIGYAQFVCGSLKFHLLMWHLV